MPPRLRTMFCSSVRYRALHGLWNEGDQGEPGFPRENVSNRSIINHGTDLSVRGSHVTVACLAPLTTCLPLTARTRPQNNMASCAVQRNSGMNAKSYFSLAESLQRMGQYPADEHVFLTGSFYDLSHGVDCRSRLLARTIQSISCLQADPLTFVRECLCEDR